MVNSRYYQLQWKYGSCGCNREEILHLDKIGLFHGYIEPQTQSVCSALMSPRKQLHTRRAEIIDLANCRVEFCKDKISTKITQLPSVTWTHLKYAFIDTATKFHLEILFTDSIILDLIF